MATRTQNYKKLGAERVQTINLDARTAAIDDDCTVGGDLSVTGTTTLGGTALAATAAEINSAADTSARLVAGGSALTLTVASHQNKVVLLDTAAGTTITLPASSGSGAIFKFLVSTTVTSNAHVIKVANSTDVFRGNIYTLSDDTNAVLGWAAAATSDTITMDGTTKGGIAGDSFEIVDYASGFFAVRGLTKSSGTEATPFSAGV